VLLWSIGCRHDNSRWKRTGGEASARCVPAVRCQSVFANCSRVCLVILRVGAGEEDAEQCLFFVMISCLRLGLVGLLLVWAFDYAEHDPARFTETLTKTLAAVRAPAPSAAAASASIATAEPPFVAHVNKQAALHEMFQPQAKVGRCGASLVLITAAAYSSPPSSTTASASSSASASPTPPSTASASASTASPVSSSSAAVLQPATSHAPPSLPAVPKPTPRHRRWQALAVAVAVVAVAFAYQVLRARDDS
jgi:hypothetical protein